MKTPLIRYGQTPQVTGLEYPEIRDLLAHPEKEAHYENISKNRMRAERAAVRAEEKSK